MPGVSDREDDPGRLFRRMDVESAPVGHGLAGIEHQVSQDLLGLERVDARHREVLGDVHLDLDVCGRGVLEQRAGSEVSHIDGLGI